MKRLLSVLVAAFMLLTLPIMTGISRAVAESTTEPAEPTTPIELEMEEMDPAKLHVHKLGEEDEEEDDGFDPGELEITDLNKIVRASIFMDGKSTIDQGYDTQGIANNGSATAYREKLRKQQETLQAKIETELGHPLTVKWNLTLLVNAISVEIPYKDVAVIRGMEGVRKVELETQYEVPEPVSVDPNTANTSENMVGATNAWYNLGYTGAGSRVAIIDTGLDTDHQSVNNDAFLHAIDEVRAEGKTVELMSSIPSSGLNGAGRRISDKIPFAYNYIDGGTRVNHQDGAGNHGSHVAGIAAANRYIKQGSSYVDAAQTVKAVGMAPDAQILVMKVFGQGGGAYDSDYFAALEDAIVLGADAANLSLGSASPGWTYDTEYQAKLNAFVNNANNHMVVSISTGNSDAYDDHTSHKLYAEDAYFHTGGSPGSYINSLSVAAAQNTLSEGMPLVFDGNLQVFYSEDTENNDGQAYTKPLMTTVAGTWDYVYIDAKGTPEDYAAVNGAVSLSGKIVIMNRGDLSFVEKGENVKSYNPKALIVANNTDGVIHMDLTDFTGNFPYIAITLKDANKIKEGATANTAGDVTYYTGRVQVTTTSTTMVTPREEAEITSFSAWGVPGSLILKPEIVAPGGDINSIYGTSNAASDAGSSTTAYALFSGTSMAAPHITGLSAVLMQYLKEVEPANTDLVNGYTLRAIAQSLLMSTATPMINNNTFLSILQQGAGLVEVSKAIEAKSVIMMDEAYLTTDTGAAADGKVKVELGDDPERKGEYDYKFTIYNISDETLTFELDTALFTQAISGDTLSHSTTVLPFEGVTYEWDGVAPAEEHDVNKDGETNELDAQAILDLVSGEIEIDDEAYDFTVADMNGDDEINTIDAKLLLDWEPGAGPDGYVVGPHDKAQVTVHIKLTDAQKAELNRAERRGAYIEGYTYVDCVTVTDEGLDLDHEHTIPILGYFGSWTDPEMFDTNSYTENLYGNEQLNYSGSQAASTNYMRVTTNGTLAKFSGNPYIVEEEFPEARLAIRSDAKINNIAYNLIRSAAGTGFAISKLDEEGNVSNIVFSTVNGQEVYGAWYHVNNQAWQNTPTKTYNINKALNEYSGLSDGDRVRVGFYAIPEYNTMLESSDLTSADAGLLTDSMFRNILTSNVLGKGAFVGFDLTIDDVDPEIVGTPTLTGNTLSISASDDKNIAYIGILSLDGTVKYAEVAPGTNEYTVSLDASDAIANASGYVAAFVGDYAGNEAAYAIKVNDNTHVEKTIFVQTDTVTAGEEYLIMNTATPGTGYGLYYTLNTSGTTATTRAFSAPINAGISDTNGKPYVEIADAAETGIWTAGTGSSGTYVTFNNNDWYLRVSNSNALTITKDTSRRDWTWNGANNRLSYSNTTRYLRYYNNTFSVSTTVNSVYMYVKTTISYEVDPYSVMSVTVTPNTLDLYRGDTASLTAKVAPLTATDRTVTWSSDNPAIATVSDVGVVTAVAAGTTKIRATSNADNTKFGECEVTVTAINKELSAAIWDEEGDVYFSYFNANNLPTWTKRHNTPTGVYATSAMMASTSALYACTNDLSVSYMYSVDRNSYTMTETGECYVMPFGMATVGTSFGGTNYFVFAFAKYILFGNLQPEDDADYGTYVGFPYGLLDLSATSVGDAYAVAICCRNKSTTSAGYYFLDENGKIWQTNQSYSNTAGITFSNPTLVYDTGINAGLQYNSLYYDGTHLYWSHQEGNDAVLYILANANTAASRKFYRAGTFGDGVWPAAGLYVNGSLAPASVEEGDEIMSEEIVGTLNLKPLMSREQLMTPEIMARFAAEAEKNNSKIVAAPEAIELPELANEPEEPEAEPEEPEEDAPRAISGVAAEGVIPFAESEASSNGLFAVAYDPEVLTLTASEKGTAENLYVSIHVDAEKGIVTVAYAVKGETPLTAGTPIATLTFEAATCGEAATIEVDTLERNNDVELDEIEEIEIPALDHIWGDPAYEWEYVDDAWKCTATAICERNSEHVLTETVTAVRTEEADKAVYTATFENTEVFEQQIKEVEIGYYLVGSITDWALDTTKKFEANPNSDVEYMLAINLAEGDEFKAVKAEGTTILSWYPDQGSNYVVGANQAGDVTVFFRPDGNGGEGWHYGYLYIETAALEFAVTIESESHTFEYNRETFVWHKYVVTVDGVALEADETGLVFALPTGDTLTITPDENAKIMHAGEDHQVENAFSYAISGHENQFIVAEPVFGTLEVTPHPVTVTVIGNNGTFIYNGTEQSVTGVTAVTEDELLNSSEKVHLMPPTPESGSGLRDFTAARTDVGTTYMGIPEDAHCGFSMTLPLEDDKDILSDFVIESVTVTDGYITIEPASAEDLGLVVTAYEAVYDGQAHSVAVNTEELPEGTTVTYSLDGEEWTTTPPTVTHVINSPITVYVKAENANYETATAEATVTILKRPVTVSVVGNNDTFEYDGEEHTVTGLTWTADDELFNELTGLRLMAPTSARASRTDIGTTYMGLPTDSSEWGGFAEPVLEQAHYLSDFSYTYVVTDGYVTITGGPAFMTQSLVLDGNIGVNFYVFLPELEGYAYQDVTFTISSADETVVVPYSPDMPTNSKGWYCFTYYVRSIQMADTITATLNYTVNDEAQTIEKLYSVKDYFLAFDESYDANPEAYTDDIVNMIRAVADFGYYIQAYLDSTREWNVPDDYAEMDKFYTTYGDDELNDAQEGLAEHEIVRETSTDITEIKFTTVLDSDITIRVFFKPARKYKGSIEFKLDGQVLEGITKQSDGRYMVEIKNIPANRLSEIHEIIVTTDNGVATVRVSALSYAKALLDAYASDPLAVNAAIALYRYSKFADILMGN